MSRITLCFSALAEKGRKALIPYVTAGDPGADKTVGIMHALVRGGADIIELGMPFSDPMAEGPIIQRACARALMNGVTLKKVLAMVAEFRQDNADTPVVLMGYLNPVEHFGIAAFARQAHEAGVDGLLIVDLPPHEAVLHIENLRALEMDNIFLLAPTSNDDRIKTVVDAGRGFIYYVSVKGVTGVQQGLDVGAVATNVARIKKATTLPVVVGFGIKNADDAKQVAAVADGVVIGSALVQTIEQTITTGENPEDMLEQQLKHIRQAIDQAIE